MNKPTRIECINMVRIEIFPEYIVRPFVNHYSDVIMDAMAYQITSLTIIYSTVYSGADQTKHQIPLH